MAKQYPIDDYCFMDSNFKKNLSHNDLGEYFELRRCCNFVNKNTLAINLSITSYWGSMHCPSTSMILVESDLELINKN